MQHTVFFSEWHAYTILDDRMSWFFKRIPVPSYWPKQVRPMYEPVSMDFADAEDRDDIVQLYTNLAQEHADV